MSANKNSFYELAKQVGQTLTKRNFLLATAESCTGGWIAEVITSIAGSSAWFERGFITYSNLAKQEMLGIKASLIEQYGAVSRQAALAMAEGALNFSSAQVSIATTGIAGPEGGTLEKPVGTVWVAWAIKGQLSEAECYHFKGDRALVRQQTVQASLERLIQKLEGLDGEISVSSLLLTLLLICHQLSLLTVQGELVRVP